MFMHANASCHAISSVTNVITRMQYSTQNHQLRHEPLWYFLILIAAKEQLALNKLSLPSLLFPLPQVTSFRKMSSACCIIGLTPFSDLREHDLIEEYPA